MDLKSVAMEMVLRGSSVGLCGYILRYATGHQLITFGWHYK